MHYCIASYVFVVLQNIVMNAAIAFFCNFCIGKHYAIQCKKHYNAQTCSATRCDSIATNCINKWFTVLECNIVQSNFLHCIAVYCIAMYCTASALTFLTPTTCQRSFYEMQQSKWAQMWNLKLTNLTNLREKSIVFETNNSFRNSLWNSDSWSVTCLNVNVNSIWWKVKLSWENQSITRVFMYLFNNLLYLFCI